MGIRNDIYECCKAILHPGSSDKTIRDNASVLGYLLSNRYIQEDHIIPNWKDISKYVEELNPLLYERDHGRLLEWQTKEIERLVREIRSVSSRILHYLETAWKK